MDEVLDIPNIPLFILDILLTIQSTNAPAATVPTVEATKEDTLVAPTDPMEKLYGGAEKIWDKVIEITRSHEMQVVKMIVAHTTAGDFSI